MVSNIIYRAVPHPIEEVLTESISDNDILHQYTSQMIFKSAHIAVEPDDSSICTLSTESLNSDITHVCIDSCDSLEEANAANLNKRKARPKKAKKHRNDLTLEPILSRVPLDVMYGNSLLTENTGIRQISSSTDKHSPVFLSVTEMLDFDQISQTPIRSTTPVQQEPISLKRSGWILGDDSLPKEKRKKISNNTYSLNQFSLEISNIKVNTTPPLSVRREMKLQIIKLILKDPELKLKKLMLFPSSKTLRTTDSPREPKLSLKRITQPSLI